MYKLELSSRRRTSFALLSDLRPLDVLSRLEPNIGHWSHSMAAAMIESASIVSVCNALLRRLLLPTSQPASQQRRTPLKNLRLYRLA